MTGIDTMNKFMVGMTGDNEFVMIMMPVRRIPKADALNLAAYIVALADPDGEEFAQILEAVKSV